MNLNHDWKIVEEPKKKRPMTPWRVFVMALAILVSIILVLIGIAWLSSVLTVIVSGTLLGYAVFFGIPPFVLASLITGGLYIVFWPLSLVGKALWSAARGKNRFKTYKIVTGAIIFSVAIATVFTIAVNLGRTISFDYKDAKTRVIIDDGNICVSDSTYCDEKF